MPFGACRVFVDSMNAKGMPAMKRILALLLAGLLALGSAASLAEQVEAAQPEPMTPVYNYDELTVAVTTPLTGSFFTSLWGNGSSDQDVRAMIHGYNLIEWDIAQGMFVTDDTVVSGIAVTENLEGDRTYSLALYNDLTYSDGTPITAWDYAFSFLLTMSNEAAEIGGNVRRPDYLLGYDDYISGRVPYLAGIRVPAQDQLDITVRAAYLPFFYELGLLDCNPYPISVIAPGVRVADDGNGVYLRNAAAGGAPLFTAELLRSTILDETTGYKTHPTVTSGPYLLTSYQSGVAEFEVNPRYKGDAAGLKPAIKRVTFKCLPQEDLVPALQEGSVGLLNKLTKGEIIQAGMTLGSENSFFTSANYARTGMSFISFNADRALVADQAVRQAIAWQLDKDEIIAETVGSYGLRTEGYYGLGQWMYQLLNKTLPYPVEEPEEGATAAELKAYEDELAAWEALTLEDLPTYHQDAEKAAALLDEAGWNLNADGTAYTSGAESIRHRRTANGLEPLQLTLAYAAGSAAGPALETVLVSSLKEAGIGVTVEALPLAELLPQYYHVTEPAYDMFFLATNFDLVYDPSVNFTVAEDGSHIWKTSGLADDTLWRSAVAMRQTKPGDLRTYCTRWLAFQKEIGESLPLLPIYSNIYFDFYPRVLHNFQIASSISWPQAVVGAYMSDVEDEAAAEPDEPALID